MVVTGATNNKAIFYIDVSVPASSCIEEGNVTAVSHMVIIFPAFYCEG